MGQADAVSAVARAMKRARTGLKDPRRPIAAMLFAGPTGVGKTELTKVRACLARSTIHCKGLLLSHDLKPLSSSRNPFVA